MNLYIATFHTHFAALCTHRAMTAANVTSSLAPVPRSLSSSCGTCVRYEADGCRLELMHRDFERVLLERPDGTFDRVDAP